MMKLISELGGTNEGKIMIDQYLRKKLSFLRLLENREYLDIKLKCLR